MRMDLDRTQRNFISEVTTSIYTLSITTKENKFRSNMRRLREMLSNKSMDVSTINLTTLSGILWFAVLDRDTESVRELIKHHPDANYMRSQINMLWMAIIRGDVDIAKMLIEAGAEVDVNVSEYGQSFLHFLVTRGDAQENLQLAKLMIDHGADVDARLNGFSVLRAAVIYENVEFVRLLLDSGAKFKGIDLIVLAARSSKAKQLLPIIVYSIDEAQLRLHRVFGALQQLIEQEDFEVDAMTALLKLDLPIFTLDIEGWTVLNIAVHYGKIDVVKLLLDHGADVNLKSNDGNFPLIWAAGYEDSSMAEFLIKNGADVHQLNDHGRRAIHNACKNMSVDNIDLLLRSGADVNVIDDDGLTPFSLMEGDILSESHKLMIKCLARKNADVKGEDLKKIRDCSDYLAYYEKCLSELREK